MGEKRCTKCGGTKPFSSFARSSKTKDWLQFKCKACDAAYRNLNAEKVKATVAKLYADRKDAYNRQRRESKTSSKYKKNNPERHAQIERQRRARKRGASGSHSLKDIFRLKSLQRGRCAICTSPLKSYHTDHVVSLFAGGSNDFYNLQLLCASCNLRKNKSDPIRHMQALGFLI